MNYEDERCLICYSSKSHFVYWGKDRLHHIEGSFKIMRCENCGCFSVLPCLTVKEMEKFYPNEKYKAYLPTDNHSKLPRSINKLGLIRKCRYVRKYIKQGSLLDIGCATGDFLKEMKQNEWEVMGIEPNLAAASVAIKKGLNVLQGTLKQIRPPSELIDVVTMWHVLEHVVNPRATVLEVSKILKPDGFFIFCIPNYYSIDARILGELWAGFDVPRHRHVFTRKGLEILFKEAGFKLKDDRCFFGEFDAFNYNLKFFLEEKFKYRRLRGFLLKVSKSILARCLIALPLYLLNKLKVGCVITFVVQKRKVG